MLTVDTAIVDGALVSFSRRPDDQTTDRDRDRGESSVCVRYEELLTRFVGFLLIHHESTVEMLYINVEAQVTNWFLAKRNNKGL